MSQPIDAAGRGVLYDGTLDCFAKVVRTEGSATLFKGFHTVAAHRPAHDDLAPDLRATRRLAGLGFL